MAVPQLVRAKSSGVISSRIRCTRIFVSKLVSVSMGVALLELADRSHDDIGGTAHVQSTKPLQRVAGVVGTMGTQHFWNPRGLQDASQARHASVTVSSPVGRVRCS